MFVRLCFCLLFASPLNAKDLYVSPAGNDRGDGTKSSPFQTIQHAVRVAAAGDTCYVLPGTYREQVVINKSGRKGAPIRIQAQGEVRLDGSDQIEGKWVKHRKNIFKVRLSGPQVEQAFDRNDKPLTMARWPNAGFADLWDRSKWAKSQTGAHKDLMICKELAESGIDWTGAVAVLNVGHQYKTWTREILSHGPGKDRFTYALEEKLGDGKDSGKNWADDRFYITNSIKALDVPGEFYHDAKAGWFYLATKNGHAPESVFVKRRDYAIKGNNARFIDVQGFDVHACSIFFNKASHVRLAECSFRFPSSRMLIGETMPAGKGRFTTPYTGITGNDNIVEDCLLAYSSGQGIAMVGQRNIVRNCVVHDVCWSGSIHFKGVSVKGIGEEPSNSLIQRCTVYNTGNIGIEHRGRNNVVEHNLVHHSGLACKDIAAIHTGSPRTEGSIVRYNIVHNIRGKGIRGDDQTRGLTVHHNLIYNCLEGMIAKGDNNKVYHNTILGLEHPGNLILPTREEPDKWWTNFERLKVQNTNSLFFNNYVGVLQYRHKPIPQNKGISHNVAYTGTAYRKELMRADAVDLNKGTVDARLRDGSKLIDAGRVVEGLTDGYKGKAPDIGAFEHGRKPWTAGASLKIRNKTDERP